VTARDTGHLSLVPPGSQLVTPEDIEAGWRVLTPEQAAAVEEIDRLGKSDPKAFHTNPEFHAVVHLARIALAGVPGKDSATCPVCQRPEAQLVDGTCVSGCGYVGGSDT
jgi:hypothetical protein